MKITDEMLYRHAAEARDIWLDTLPNDDELPNHQFSDGFMASIKNAEAQHKRQKTSRKYLQRVAALFLVFLLGSGTWLAVDIEARASASVHRNEVLPDLHRPDAFLLRRSKQSARCTTSSRSCLNAARLS